MGLLVRELSHYDTFYYYYYYYYFVVVVVVVVVLVVVVVVAPFLRFAVSAAERKR
jgi:hypothetical protein